MYYMLDCEDPEDADHAMLEYEEDDPNRSWHSGTRFKKPPPQPIKLEVHSDYPGVIPEYASQPVPIMSKRLLEALKDAGVTNIDAYEAEIYDPPNKKRYKDWVVVNIVGKVAAADMAKSDYDFAQPDRMISMDFNKVVINRGAAKGALLFRLAESVNAVVIHEKVKKHLEKNGIKTLTFIPPEEWAG